MTIWNFAEKKRTGLKTRRYKGPPEKSGEERNGSEDPPLQERAGEERRKKERV
jgi:hypothetical protein